MAPSTLGTDTRRLVIHHTPGRDQGCGGKHYARGYLQPALCFAAAAHGDPPGGDADPPSPWIYVQRRRLRREALRARLLPNALRPAGLTHGESARGRAAAGMAYNVQRSDTPASHGYATGLACGTS